LDIYWNSFYGILRAATRYFPIANLNNAILSDNGDYIVIGGDKIIVIDSKLGLDSIKTFHSYDLL